MCPCTSFVCSSVRSSRRPAQLAGDRRRIRTSRKKAARRFAPCRNRSLAKRFVCMLDFLSAHPAQILLAGELIPARLELLELTSAAVHHEPVAKHLVLARLQAPVAEQRG